MRFSLRACVGTVAPDRHSANYAYTTQYMLNNISYSRKADTGTVYTSGDGIHLNHKDVVAMRSGHVRTESFRDRQQSHTSEKGIPLIAEKGKAIMKKILVVVCLALLLGSFVSVECATAADRFVNNNDGTVTDTQTKLMWADKDNGSDIGWSNAKSYCEEYSVGGKSDWRMPTLDELAQLYSSGAYGSVITKTGPLIWASELSGSDAAFFGSNGGSRYLSHQSFALRRALPVRNAK